MRTALLLGFVTIICTGSARLPPLGLDLYVPAPADNPGTRSKIALGRQLFHDRGLSRDGTISCATCHQAKRAFSDGRRVAVGISGALGVRNTPSLVNRGYASTLFWDGRAASLEQQVTEPLINPRELASSPERVTAYVEHEYGTRFRQTFGRHVNFNDVGRALAAYVRTIRSGSSRFDRYEAGYTAALTTRELAGMRLFQSKAGCTSCHAGPTFSDDAFHNTGIAFREERWTDRGRYEVSRAAPDIGAFKTPSLREAARTPPYMHDGSIRTLKDVVNYYDRGGNRNPYLDTAIRPLHLTASEKDSLVQFLKTLTGVVTEGN